MQMSSNAKLLWLTLTLMALLLVFQMIIAPYINAAAFTFIIGFGAIGMVLIVVAAQQHLARKERRDK